MRWTRSWRHRETGLAARRAAMLLPHVSVPAWESVRAQLGPGRSGRLIKGEAEFRRLLRVFRSAAPADNRLFIDTGALTITSNWRSVPRR